ncbi:MAG: long-chain fatty acid--CoA ligase [Chloroflexota bacterium]
MLTPHKVALVDAERGNRPVTYREWNRAANRTANRLRSLGVGRGDLVAVLSMNCVEYLDIWFACGKLGAIMQTLNWRLTATELSALLGDAVPHVLIYGSNFNAQVNAIRGAVPSIKHYSALDGDNMVAPDDVAFAERDYCPDDAPPAVALTLDAPWAICYTGGTTGLPKGAILTHGNVAWNSINTVVSWGLVPTDRTILNSPLFHTGGLNVLTAPLVHIGGTSIVCKGFDPAQVFDFIDNGDVNLYFGVPTMFVAMQQHPRWDTADFSRLRWVISGGAPCPPPIFERWWERGVEFKMGYGMTESGPNTFWLPSEEVRRKPGSVGLPLFHVDVKAIEPDGSECAPGEIGELLIRGPQVVPGYWNRAEESAQTIVDGWLHTGDLARRDEEGFYYIVGRLKEMFISGGENIYPAEIEAVLAGHHDVESTALIGVPDAHWGEVGCAIVTVRSGSAITAEGLLDYARERLARFKVPKQIIFTDSLPVTGAGKTDKRLLMELYGQGSPAGKQK